MGSDSALKVLLVAEGSGGHLIPALQVANRLAKRGAHIKVWYAQRQQTASLAAALTQGRVETSVDVDPIPMTPSANPLWKLWQCGQLWYRAQQCFDTFAPDIVVGFGGWISAPVVLAARKRRIGCLLHEQNVVLGRANQLLSPWVDRVAVSFRETQATLHRTDAVMTGMPVRDSIGQSSRAQAAQRFGLSSERPTLLLLGGSQGSRTMNQLMVRMVPSWSSEERKRWQVVHVTGLSDETVVREVYATHGVNAWVTPFLIEMEAAYAQADVVIARAGASTIAELARCGKPSILIPYPYAGGHQRANAKVVEAIGGGLMIEESAATPERVLDAVRRMLTDQRLRAMMGAQMQGLHRVDAAERLSQVILEFGRPLRRQAGQGMAMSSTQVLRDEKGPLHE